MIFTKDLGQEGNLGLVGLLLKGRPCSQGGVEVCMKKEENEKG